MNPHASQPTSPAALVSSFWHHKTLIGQMIKREVLGRYRGSAFGLLWSFLNPVLMLLVYTFFFAVVFKARWPNSAADASKADFAIILFVGMIVHAFLAEVLNRAPSLIVHNANYVKKVVFPLETLSAISIGAALFHALISFGVLVLAILLIHQSLHWTIIFAPLVLLPLVILSLGLSWILAALGVYVRDLAQSMGLITTVLMFLAPVFYATSSLPAHFQPLVMLNPLTFIIEQSREVLIWGNLPNLAGLLAYTAIASLVAWLGFVWFQKTRKGFADVI